MIITENNYLTLLQNFKQTAVKIVYIKVKNRFFCFTDLTEFYFSTLIGQKKLILLALHG